MHCLARCVFQLIKPVLGSFFGTIWLLTKRKDEEKKRKELTLLNLHATASRRYSALLIERIDDEVDEDFACAPIRNHRNQHKWRVLVDLDESLRSMPWTSIGFTSIVHFQNSCTIKFEVTSRISNAEITGMKDRSAQRSSSSSEILHVVSTRGERKRMRGRRRRRRRNSYFISWCICWNARPSVGIWKKIADGWSIYVIKQRGYSVYSTHVLYFSAAKNIEEKSNVECCKHDLRLTTPTFDIGGNEAIWQSVSSSVWRLNWFSLIDDKGVTRLAIPLSAVSVDGVDEVPRCRLPSLWELEWNNRSLIIDCDIWKYSVSRDGWAFEEKERERRFVYSSNMQLLRRRIDPRLLEIVSFDVIDVAISMMRTGSPMKFWSENFWALVFEASIRVNDAA